MQRYRLIGRQNNYFKLLVFYIYHFMLIVHPSNRSSPVCRILRGQKQPCLPHQISSIKKVIDKRKEISLINLLIN